MEAVVSEISPVLLRRKIAEAIEAAIEASFEQPTVWGQCDCALWCANVLRGPLGYDPAASFRNRYTTPRGYLRVLKNMGYASLDEALASAAAVKGWKAIAPSDADIGDVGLAPHESGRRTAMLYRGGGFWVGHANYGFGCVQTEYIDKAYRITA